jgi:hypothetical protein
MWGFVNALLLTFKLVAITIPLWVEYQRLGKTVVEKRLSPIWRYIRINHATTVIRLSDRVTDYTLHGHVGKPRFFLKKRTDFFVHFFQFSLHKVVIWSSAYRFPTYSHRARVAEYANKWTDGQGHASNVVASAGWLASVRAFWGSREPLEHLMGRRRPGRRGTHGRFAVADTRRDKGGAW